MTLKQQLGKLKCKNFLFLTIAGMVNAFGVTMFIAPVDLYDSGISGTSILLSQLTPEWLSLSFFLMVLNHSSVFYTDSENRVWYLPSMRFTRWWSILSGHG